MQYSSNTNTLFPVFLKLHELNTLIVGGGKVGYEKLNAMLTNSPLAKITLVAEAVSEEVRSLADKHSQIEIYERAFHENDIQAKDLVIAATSDKNLNEQIKTLAKSNRILVNVADTPALCDFYLSSVVQKGHLKLGISTNGQSPTMAKRVKQLLDDAIPHEINESIENLHQIRNRLNGSFAQKVDKLNRITEILVKQDKAVHPLKKEFKHYFAWIILAAFAVGFFVAAMLSKEPISSFMFSLNERIHPQFYLFLLAGFAAQLIDGSLGMAYGVSSTSFLLSLGVPPVVTTASVHASEIIVYAAGSYTYAKYKQINKKLFKSLVFTAIAGSITGAVLLNWLGVYVKMAKPLVAIYCMILGVLIIRKVLVKKIIRKKKTQRVGLLGFVGGLLDTMGGGGWGPLVTTSLIVRGRNLRYTIGSAHLAKFFMAVAGSITFMFLLRETYYWHIILGLMIGGAMAAPISIWLSTKIPVKTGLIIVGITVILLSLKTLVKVFI